MIKLFYKNIIMVETKYTQKQSKELLNNPYVQNCTESYITFTNKVKYDSVILRKSLLKCRDIFEKLGFPKYIVDSEVPIKNISKWNKSINIDWNIGKKWRKQNYDNIDIKKFIVLWKNMIYCQWLEKEIHIKILRKKLKSIKSVKTYLIEILNEQKYLKNFELT